MARCVNCALAICMAFWVCEGVSKAAETAGPHPSPPIYLVVSIDVETTTTWDFRRDVWGEFPGGEPYGIQKIMDILDRHGDKGTFFVNVYERPGHSEMAEVCRTIAGRGHDVELHTHPKPVFGMIGMAYMSRAEQDGVLEYGKDLIHQYTGQWPIAHRAGNFSANLLTILACRDAGLPLEFSANVVEQDLALALSTRNAPVVWDGVLCVPVTCYKQFTVGTWQSHRILDIESASPEEICKVVRDLHGQHVAVAVLLMHSFSMVRDGTANKRVARALDQVLGELGKDPAVRVVTANQLYEMWGQNPKVLEGADCEPQTGIWMMYGRAWQRLAEGWKNVVVAFGPVCFGLVVSGLIGYRWRLRRKRKAGAA